MPDLSSLSPKITSRPNRTGRFTALLMASCLFTTSCIGCGHWQIVTPSYFKTNDCVGREIRITTTDGVSTTMNVVSVDFPRVTGDTGIGKFITVDVEVVLKVDLWSPSTFSKLLPFIVFGSILFTAGILMWIYYTLSGPRSRAHD